MERIPAIVVKVVPSKIETDHFNGKRYEVGNYVIVQEVESRQLHTLINGSMNQVPIQLRKVDTVGYITWHKSASFNLPFFAA
jgi:hypothetical protein